MKIRVGHFEIRIENNSVEVGCLHPEVGFWMLLKMPTPESPKTSLTVRVDELTTTVEI